MMNTQFNSAFKGPGINQILMPTISAAPAVIATPTETNKNLFNVLKVVAFIGIGIYVGYKISEKIRMNKIGF